MLYAITPFNEVSSRTSAVLKSVTQPPLRSHLPDGFTPSEGIPLFGNNGFSSISHSTKRKIKLITLGSLGAVAGAVGSALAVASGGILAPIVLGVTSAVAGATIAGIIGGKQEGFSGLARGLGFAVVGGALGLIGGVMLGIYGGAAAPVIAGFTGATAGGMGGIFLAIGKK